MVSGKRLTIVVLTLVLALGVPGMLRGVAADSSWSISPVPSVAPDGSRAQVLREAVYGVVQVQHRTDRADGVFGPFDLAEPPDINTNLGSDAAESPDATQSPKASAIKSSVIPQKPVQTQTATPPSLAPNSTPDAPSNRKVFQTPGGRLRSIADSVADPVVTRLVEQPAPETSCPMPGEESSLAMQSGWLQRPFGDGVGSLLQRPGSGAMQTVPYEGWNYRPGGVSWFVGMMQGGPLMPGWMGMDRGYYGGARVSWDVGCYWGGEFRLSSASIAVFDTPRAIAAAEEENGDSYDKRRGVDVYMWDLDVLYYPWGDTPFRPYFTVGFGAASLDVTDRLAHRYKDTLFSLPVGIGFKHRFTSRLALRFELADNIFVGGASGFSTVHNVSFTGGIELRFGAPQKSYWPYNPGHSWW